MLAVIETSPHGQGSTQYLQLVQGLSALHAALWLLPAVVALTAGNMLAPKLVPRIRPGRLIVGSLVIVSVGLVMLTRGRGGTTSGPSRVSAVANAQQQRPESWCPQAVADPVTVSVHDRRRSATIC